MRLLAIDTSGAAVTVAVLDGDDVLAEVGGSGAMAHGELLAPAVRDALTQAGLAMSDLTDLAVGVGPGPFTGLRVGVVTALTLGDALGLPVHGVCSLDAVAHAALAGGAVGGGALGDTTELVVATDARRKEVYWARYDGTRRLEGPAVDKPADLVPRLRGATVVGRGAALYPELGGTWTEEVSAAHLARAVAAATVEVLLPEPLYLRRPDATEPGVIKLA